jgi:branched-chain amino acid transport system substrate-binding protein
VRRLALVVVAIAALTGACSRDLRAPITIGIVSPCRGTFGALYEPTLAAAELPLIARGATPRGTLPSQGLRAANAQGRPVRVVLGCSDGSAETAIREARRLVESQGAQILIGALVDPEGLALKRYAARQPGVTFITTSSDQSVTLEHPRANLYRFASDSAQSVAGLGSYAYRRLHWRNVVILGQPTSFGYGEAAGFASEFCSLGGAIEARMWAPAGTGAAKAAVARLSRGNVDGAAVFSLMGGLDLIRAFAPRGPLRGKVVVDVILGAGGAMTGAFGPRAVGVAWAWPAATDPRTQAWTHYVSSLERTFPRQRSIATSPLAIAYFTSMEAVLRALAAAGSDLADGQRTFRSSLSRSRFESPLGHVRLDANRQLVATNRVALVRAQPDARPVRTVTGIEQGFAADLTSPGLLPGPQTPACRHGNPPAWAVRR